MTRPARSLEAIVVSVGVSETPTAIGPTARNFNIVGRRPPVDSPSDFLDQAFAREVFDNRRDRRTLQVGLPRNLRSRDRLALPPGVPSALAAAIPALGVA